jgi:hypothetical protein
MQVGDLLTFKPLDSIACVQVGSIVWVLLDEEVKLKKVLGIGSGRVFCISPSWQVGCVVAEEPSCDGMRARVALYMHEKIEVVVPVEWLFFYRGHWSCIDTSRCPPMKSETQGTLRLLNLQLLSRHPALILAQLPQQSYVWLRTEVNLNQLLGSCTEQDSSENSVATVLALRTRDAMIAQRGRAQVRLLGSKLSLPLPSSLSCSLSPPTRAFLR